MKKCTNCNLEKPKTEFYKEAAQKDGLRTECKVCRNQKAQVWRENNREQYNAVVKKANRKRYPIARLQRYGITLEQYNQMLTQQNNLCKICNKPQVGKRPLAVDHCHETNKVRGLLCYNCNRGMHYIDNAEFLTKALKYKSA